MRSIGKSAAEALSRLSRNLMRAMGGLVFLGIAAGVSGAQAQSCSTTTSTIAFGNVDVLPGTDIDGVGTITIACSGFTGSNKLLLCFGIDNGTYPPSGSARQMGSGANRLTFNVFKDAARSVIWTDAGSGLAGATITSTAQNATLTIYARISASQQSAPPAAYSTVLNEPVSGKFYTTGTPPVCGAQPLFGTDPINVSATVVSACTVTTTNLNFGSVSLMTSNIDASNSVSVICTQTTPYQVRLDGGLAAATDPTLRKMSFGANKVTYGLYRDAPRALPWGATDGTNTQAGTGTSSAVSHTVYGRIPPQASQPPGTYTDTVVVTVSFL